jgi:hypothetical protein
MEDPFSRLAHHASGAISTGTRAACKGRSIAASLIDIGKRAAADQTTLI